MGALVLDRDVGRVWPVPNSGYFEGDLEPLSNFYAQPRRLSVTVHGVAHWVTTVEHGYQASKALTAAGAQRVLEQRYPGRAKATGRSVALRADWEDVKDGVMLALLRQKFDQPLMRRVLLRTGDLSLVEVNHWGDRYWGAEVEPGRGDVGANVLGQMLMHLRSEALEAGYAP